MNTKEVEEKEDHVEKKIRRACGTGQCGNVAKIDRREKIRPRLKRKITCGA